jgi:hypothetical protein
MVSNYVRIIGQNGPVFGVLYFFCPLSTLAETLLRDRPARIKRLPS